MGLESRPDLPRSIVEVLWSKLPFATDLDANVEEQVREVSLAVVALLGLGLIASGVAAGLTVQLPVAGLVVTALVNLALAAARTLAVDHLSIAHAVPTQRAYLGRVRTVRTTVGLLADVSRIVQVVVTPRRASGSRCRLCPTPVGRRGRATRRPSCPREPSV